MRDHQLGFTLFVTVQNIGDTNIQIMTRHVQCCEVMSHAATDCKSIKMMGGFIGEVLPGNVINATWTYPTLYEYNRQGECLVDLWWKDSLNRTDTKRFSIPFNTHITHIVPAHMTEYRKAWKILGLPRCRTPDLDVLDNCQPVDCHKKYDGNKNYFSNPEGLCVESPTCWADPDKDPPDVAISSMCNTCADLESPIDQDDMGYLLRPAVDMDVYAAYTGKRCAKKLNTLKCHHGKINDARTSCICQPGWTSEPVPIDFLPHTTVFTHMCTVFVETTIYVAISHVVKEFSVILRDDLGDIFFICVLIGLLLVLLTCIIDQCCIAWWCKRQQARGKGIAGDMCTSYDLNMDYDSDFSAICSEDNWSTDESLEEFCRLTSPVSSDEMTDELVAYSTNPRDLGVSYVRPSVSQYSAAVPRGRKGSQSPKRQKMFETHLRLLIVLLLRRNPCPEAREHLDWIFQNCPSYQRRLVVKFMRSIGVHIDSQGNITRSLNRKGMYGSSVFRRNDGRSMSSRGRRRRRIIKPKKRNKWHVRRCMESADKRHKDQLSEEDFEVRMTAMDSTERRDEPDGESDVDSTVAIVPNCRDILTSVIPNCNLPTSEPHTNASSSSTNDNEPAKETEQELNQSYEDRVIELRSLCRSARNVALQPGVTRRTVASLLRTVSALQTFALRSYTGSNAATDTISLCKLLTNIEMIRRSYTKFIDRFPLPIALESCSDGMEVCSALEIVHRRLTDRTLTMLAVLYDKYRKILLNKSKSDLDRKTVETNIIPVQEEKTFMKFFKNLVHFLFLMSCKRQTMIKIKKTFGCSKHRNVEKLDPHVCLFLCYIRPVVLKFVKVIEVEKVLVDYFMLECPRHICSRFLKNLMRTTKLRIRLYLHLYKIMAMITNKEGLAESLRIKFASHVTVLELDLTRFFKDIEATQEIYKEIKPSYVLVGALLSILEILHYFMVKSLYKLCLLHVDDQHRLQ